MLVFVMYYIYVTSGSSLLIESTDSMILTKNYIIACMHHVSKQCTAETIIAFLLDMAFMHACPDPFEILFGWRVWV